MTRIMAALHPADNPMHWPIDIFSERAAYASQREQMVLKLDEKSAWKQQVLEAGEIKIEAEKLRRMGIMPFFVS